MVRSTIIFILFVIIFISDDTLLFGTNSNELFILFKYILYLGLLFYLAIKLKLKIQLKIFIISLLIILSFFSTMLINNDFREGYLVQLLIIILAAVISINVRFNDFAHYYNKIIYFISAFSLLAFIILNLIPSLINYLPVVTNYGGMKYGTLILMNILKSGNKLVNISIFREPGVFVIYLIIGLIIELYYNKEINYKRLFIYIISIITSYSTAGYIISAFVIFVYVLKTNNLNLKIGFLILIVFFFIFFFPILMSKVFSKFDPQSYEYRSTLSRISSFVIPFMMFIQHIYGIGLTNFSELYSSYSMKYFGISLSPGGESTNTILNTFAIYGLLYGIILICGLIKFSKLFNSSKINIIIVFITLLLISVTQELRFSLLFNVFVMYGFVYHVNTSNAIVAQRIA